MTISGYLSQRAARRDVYRRFLVEHGLDNRSLARLTFERLDPKVFIAFSIIGLFGWAFATEQDINTRNLMVGALIAAFAGAWGFYLGSSNSANQANDRANRLADTTHEAVRELRRDRADAGGDIEIAPGERRTIEGAGEAERET